MDSDAELQRSYGAIAEFLCGEAREPSTAWIEVALPILGRVQGRDQGPKLFCRVLIPCCAACLVDGSHCARDVGSMVAAWTANAIR